MRIVGFMGSPRQKHNTAVLVGEVLQGAKEQGAEIQVYDLNELNIYGCQACMTCKSEDACALDDDMGRLYEEVLQADGVVIGSPVYMWQMSAQTKLFVDRLFAMLRPDFSTRFKRGLPLVLVFTQAQPDSGAFETYFDYTRKMLEFLGFEVKDTLVATGTQAKDDVLKQEDVLARAKRVGQGLVA